MIVAANIAIRNVSGHVIGPKMDMNWISKEEMNPLSNAIIKNLENKTNAVAWLVDDCTVIRPHETFIINLMIELAKYNQSVHILGRCGKNNEAIMACYTEQNCYDTIKSRYYFYLSFENAISEDYVTNELLIPLKNYAVPIVFGGANYSR